MTPLYVMINEAGRFRIVKIINISGSALTDIKGNKYNIEKVMYIWKDGKPYYNKMYVPIHFLREVNNI